MMFNEQVHSRTCAKCGKIIKYNYKKDTYFDNSGYGYSTRLVKCPECNTPNVLTHYEDRAMKLNNDRRYYDYRKLSFTE